jgi:hypothetical protein
MQDYEQILIDSNPTILNFDFTSQLLALDLTFGNKRSTWYQAGYVIPLVNVDGDFYEDKAIKLRFDKQILEIPYRAYRLRFEPVDWAQNVSIKIKQLPPTDYRLMYVTTEHTITPRETGEPIYTSVIPAAPTATPPTFTIVASRSRRSCLISNKTNKPMFIKEGSAASAPTLTATDPFVSIPAGGNYTIEDWSGEIVGIMSAAFQAGGKINVKELPYIVP